MEGQNSKPIRSGKRQRDLRRNATDAERELWRHLRCRQIDGAKFRRQHPFGHYILDFACLERRIAIELDGGQHAEQTSYDARRTRFLGDAGFVVLRFWNNEVFENSEGVLEVIWTATRDRANPSPPKPSP
jgi:very-short-patch-repair endonuclease